VSDLWCGSSHAAGPDGSSRIRSNSDQVQFNAARSKRFVTLWFS
jgi:hypothetical protein